MKWEHNSPRSADMVISLSLVIRRLGSGKANNSIYEIKIKELLEKKYELDLCITGVNTKIMKKKIQLSKLIR